MGTAAWVARTGLYSTAVGLETTKALARARNFLDQLREGQVEAVALELDDSAIDVLYAALELIASVTVLEASAALEVASLLYGFMEESRWRQPDFGERAELLDDCALWAWRLARRSGKLDLADQWVRRMARRNELESRFRPVSLESLQELEGVGFFLVVCQGLRDRVEATPTEVLDQSAVLYGNIDKARRPIGPLDEKQYLLGEIALIAGAACRVMGRRAEAVRWFENSRRSFLLTTNAIADCARLSYQCLALAMEQRQFETVTEQLPSLIECFEDLGMREDAVKSYFLEGNIQSEIGDFAAAAACFEGVCERAERIGSERLLAIARVNLLHVYAKMGRVNEALHVSAAALPVVERIGSKLGLAKIQWGIGSLLRKTGRIGEAIAAFGEARQAFSNSGMAAESVACSLHIADLLLGVGDDAGALREIVAAIPTIEQLSMVPEAVAALTLLRESVRHHRVNHQALRDLHGFFEDSVS